MTHAALHRARSGCTGRPPCGHCPPDGSPTRGLARRRVAPRDCNGRRLVLLQAVVALLSACATDLAAGPAGPIVAATYGKAVDPPATTARFLYVVGGDYATSALSVVDLADLATADVTTLPPIAAHILHSGSKVGPVTTALSGDVVLAQSSPGLRRAIVVDRANGVLSVMDPQTLTVAVQFSVGSGFYANPQDALALPNGRWLVTRMGRNAHPTGELTGGDDIAHLQDGKLVGRTALTEQATVTGHIAAPQRLTAALGQVWMGLGSFAPDFKAVGSGRLVGLSADGGAVQSVVDFASARNCVTVAGLGADAVVAACQGSFAKGQDQIAQSAIVVVRPQGNHFAATTLAQADGTTGPWSRDLAVADGSVVAVSLGDLTTSRPDRLWRVDGATGARTVIASSAQPFGFSGLWYDRARRVVWVGERNAASGDLRRFALSNAGQSSEGKPVRSNPRGLGALDLAGF